MPKNRRELDAGAKRDALAKAAAQVFLRSGFDSSSIAEIATVAGVAPNTLYWYFKDKDALLVAALNEYLGKILSSFSAIKDYAAEARWHWILAELDHARGLIATVHSRIAQSAHISAWHQQFHHAIELLLIADFKASGMDAQAAREAAIMATLVLEGLLLHPNNEVNRDIAIRWLSHLPGRISTAGKSGESGK